MNDIELDYSSALAEELLANGYCIIREAVRISTVNVLAADLADDFAATPRSVGAFYGNRTRRFHGLLARSANTADFVLKPLITEIVEQHLDHMLEFALLFRREVVEVSSHFEDTYDPDEPLNSANRSNSAIAPPPRSPPFRQSARLSLSPPSLCHSRLAYCGKTLENRCR